MIVIIGSWAVVSFIYFKVTLDAVFSNDSSIIAAILLGAMVGVTVFASAGFYALINGQHQAHKALGKRSNPFRKCIPVFLVSIGTNLVIGKLIVFGFSKRLNRDLGGDVFYEFGRYKTDDSIAFIVILSIPLLVHLLTILFSIRRGY